VIVVDLGCERHDRDWSMELLVGRFSPHVLYGFDPAAIEELKFNIGDTLAFVSPLAAWTDDGIVEFSSGGGIDGTVMADSKAWNGSVQTVRCFDFSKWMCDFDVRDAVVKMDIEGAELPVLEKLIVDGNDKRIGLLLVEWHDSQFDYDYVLRRANVEALLHCPVEVWH
jgi:FkbM family methyltransferase